jgi:hypothetical protein
MGTFTIDGIEYEESDDDDDMTYKISTKDKNSISEQERWKKGENHFYITRTWRWGYVIVNGEPMFPEGYSPDLGVDVNDAFDVIDVSYDDADIEYEFIGDLSEEEQEQIIQRYEEDSDEALEDLDWRPKDTECWFFGELEITKFEY